MMWNLSPLGLNSAYANFLSPLASSALGGAQPASYASVFAASAFSNFSAAPNTSFSSLVSTPAYPSGGQSPDLMQLALLFKLLRGQRQESSAITQQVTNLDTVAPTTQVVNQTVPDPQDAVRANLLAGADDALKSGLFNADELNNLKGKSAKQQYKDTVARAYGGAQLRKGVKKKTKTMVADGTWKYGDWNLNELNAELGGKFGQMSKQKMKLQNIGATSATNLTWHSTPFHMAMAQKYLDEAKKLESYIKANGGTVSSASSGTSSGPVSSSQSTTVVNTTVVSSGPGLSELQAKAQELRDRAGLHFQIARTTMSPVIMDTDGNGKIDLTSVKNGVKFDLDGDGQKEQVAWTQAKGKETDSWLSLDRNGNGQIDSGKELFGNQHGKANGYEELKQFDDNRDGVIDRKDAVYQKLKMWQDRNHDGISQADEMVGLDKAGVESVTLGYTESKDLDSFGNELRQQSNFRRTDANAREIAEKQGLSLEAAKTGLAVDAWLQYNKAS